VVLWGRPKREILRQFSSVELEELRVYRTIEPWGGEWDNLRAGTVATAAAGANPFRKPQNVPSPGDWFKRSKGPRQSVKQARGIADRAAERFAKWRKKKTDG